MLLSNSKSMAFSVPSCRCFLKHDVHVHSKLPASVRLFFILNNTHLSNKRLHSHQSTTAESNALLVDGYRHLLTPKTKRPSTHLHLINKSESEIEYQLVHMNSISYFLVVLTAVSKRVKANNISCEYEWISGGK